MKLAEVEIAHPYISYQVETEHYTSRKSTAMEWVILQAIQIAENYPESYANIAVSSVFEYIFNIADPNEMVLPDILSLQDMGAIMAEGLDNNTDLDDEPMCSLRLTDVGREMQKQGLLPGTLSKDRFSVYYDPVTKGLMQRAPENLKETPVGLVVNTIDTLDEVLFPEMQVRTLLMEARGKRKSCFSWLMPTTEIQHITQKKATLQWKNMRKVLEVGEGLMCTMIGMTDSSVQEALRSLFPEVSEAETEIPFADIKHPDEQLESLFSPEDLRKQVQERLKEARFIIVDQDYFSNEVFQQTSKSTGKQKSKPLRVALVSGAETFSVDLRKHTLVVYLPDRCLPPDVIYAESSHCLCLGKFRLRTPEYEKVTAFGYIPKQHGLVFAELCIKIVLQYSKQDIQMLFVLYAMGMKEQFLDVIAERVRACATIDEQTDLLQKIDEISKQYDSLPEEFFKRVLVEEMDFSSSCADANGLLQVLNRYKSIPMFQKNNTLYQAVLQRALQAVQPCDSIDTIWNIWAQLSSANMKWVTKNTLYRILYRENALTELLVRFEQEDFFKNPEYTPIEKTVLELKRVFVRMSELLPELDVRSKYSEEGVRAAVIKNKQKIKDMYEEIRNWKECIATFELCVLPLEQVANRCAYFHGCVTMMERIMDSVAIFMDDDAVRFEHVYVLDTCALMHKPALLSVLGEDGKSMVVVPQVVLNELDNKKTDEDTETSYQARSAINAISDFKTQPWLKLGVQSCPELLDGDFDTKRPDNQILSIAIKYLEKMTVLVTDDKNFGNIARGQGVVSMDAETCMQEKMTKQKVSDKKRKKNQDKKNKHNKRK